LSEHNTGVCSSQQVQTSAGEQRSRGPRPRRIRPPGDPDTKVEPQQKARPKYCESEYLRSSESIATAARLPIPRRTRAAPICPAGINRQHEKRDLRAKSSRQTNIERAAAVAAETVARRFRDSASNTAENQSGGKNPVLPANVRLGDDPDQAQFPRPGSPARPVEWLSGLG
jgi:hypothetical protein